MAILRTTIWTPLPLHIRSPLHHQRKPFKFCIQSSSTSLQEQTKTQVKSEIKESRKGDLIGFLPPLKAAKRVVLVRHGQSTWNEAGRIQGSSDFSVLTQKGEAQAETSRQMLTGDSFDVCFSSPLIRSKRTAEIVWDTRQEDIITDPDLREIDLYSFQGLLKHEGKAKYGSIYQQWQIDPANFCIDDHYPVRELWARARSCWEKILTHESKSILVVAHNAVNQALVATALGLGTEYFRMLLQSNCGASVLDFTPHTEGGSPTICLNRLNQTPNSPVAGSSNPGDRKTSTRIILVCHGKSQNDSEGESSYLGEGPMNMLGIIQAQKIAEFFLDLKINTIVSSTKLASMETANAISRVQEAADCLGADCVPRYVDTKQIEALDVENIFKKSNKVDASSQSEDETTTALWEQSEKAWRYLLDELSVGSEEDNIVLAVSNPAIHKSILGHCLNLTKEWIGSFHLDSGSISVIDFPDGAQGKGVVRCINYTAHLGRWSVPITRPTSDDEDF